MLKIICTSLQEKRELLEAADHLRSLKGVDSKLPMVSFLVGLAKNPGAIEIVEQFRVQKVESFRRTPSKKRKS